MAIDLILNLLPAKCPSCRVRLSKRPKRKTKCPACGALIYVKRAPDESEKRLVTEAQASEIEQLWDARGQARQADDFCRMFGVDRELYDRTRARLANASEPASLGWMTEYAICRQRAAKEPDHQDRKMLYFYLALLADKKNLYAERRAFITKSHEAELLRHKQSLGAVVGVEIRPIRPNVCSRCRENSGKRYTLDEALAAMPLPCEGCTCRDVEPGLCQCDYRTLLRSDP